MTKELTTLALATMKIEGVASPQRMCSVWIGMAANVCSADWSMHVVLSQFSPADVDPEGIVHRKCF